MDRVAVETVLGSGQGAIMTSNHTWSSGIGFDVVLVIWYGF